MMKERSPERSGGLTGALLGAVSRPVVVSAFWFSAKDQAGTWLTLLLSSCLIGLLLGLLAGRIAGYRGSIRRPWTGPLIGAVLGAALGFASSVVTLTCLCVLMFDRHEPRGLHRDVSISLYWTVMGIVGAFPGLCGGLAANRVRTKLAPQILDVHLGSVDGTSDSSD
jgi:hypothetical protein